MRALAGEANNYNQSFVLPSSVSFGSFKLDPPNRRCCHLVRINPSSSGPTGRDIASHLSRACWSIAMYGGEGGEEVVAGPSSGPGTARDASGRVALCMSRRNFNFHKANPDVSQTVITNVHIDNVYSNLCYNKVFPGVPLPINTAVSVAVAATGSGRMATFHKPRDETGPRRQETRHRRIGFVPTAYRVVSEWRRSGCNGRGRRPPRCRICE